MFYPLRMTFQSLLLFAVIACSDTENKVDDSNDEASTSAPFYSQKDGNTYMYVEALSADDQTQGNQAQVYNIRFLGAEGKVHRLEEVDDYGKQQAVYECSFPCRVVKEMSNGSLTRKAVQKDSFLDFAFLDAFNGMLVQSDPPPDKLNNSNLPPENLDEHLDAPTRTSMQIAKPMISGKWASYKTRIFEGWNTGETFGGRFVIIRMGCGTGCSFNIVGDHQTGLIYDLGLGGEEMQMLDLQFSDQNNLIQAQWEDFDTDSCISQTFLWSGVKLDHFGERKITPRRDCSNPS